MIIDSLSNLSHYRFLHPNLDRAIDYLMQTDLQELSYGRHAIKGDQVFLNYGENQLIENPENKYEYHRHYADIHIVMEGAETISYGYQPQETLVDYQLQEDYGFDACQSSLEVTLKPGYFLIFFPEERHRPGGLADSGFEMVKVVVKALMDDSNQVV
ncbi:YhcH/YjgK/YiaL family protein [Streptococcus iniae]|uniref:YhcH/YjgK/YiaL family protein n=1 Tax=Streptococcus iniae TaxID=1346 RepID=UPI0008DA7FD7|nr:YhcH/YjgK/YiaL family protein [Streptococcus iniae]OHX28401.1 hypothetical protein BKX95_00660 [Streptococcus iniae]RLV27054.1 YhcH/YjgK/YiaL family protein [Streptococcus iniae]